MLLPLDRPVSIDIGSSSVKVAQLIEGRGGVRAIRFAEQEFTKEFRWEVGGDRAPLVEAVREALAKAGIRGRRAIIPIPRRQVTARISAFPQADREELRRVVEYDLVDHIPFPADQVVVDFQPLGHSREQPGLTDVLVVAAPRELVREYLRLAEDLGLRAMALTVDALALHDLVRTAEREPPGLTVALEIGARATTINVSDGERLRLTRSVGIGGHHLTRAIQEDFGVDPAEAERLKRTDGLRLLGRKQGALRVAAWLENLQGEIRRSALSSGPAVVSRIMFTGGGSATPGLSQALRAEFGVEPILLAAAEVFSGSQLLGSDSETADRCLLAMAASLQAVGRSAWTVSLLPGEVVRARRALRLRRATVLAAMAVVVAMAAAYLLAAREVGAREGAVNDLRRHAKIAEEQRTQAEALRAEQERLHKQLASLELVRARRHAALELLRSIALYAPDEVILTHFTMRPDQPLDIRGTAPTSTIVADLQQALGRSPLVTEVSLTSADRTTPRGQPGDVVSFTMRVKLWIEREATARAPSLSPWGGAE